MNIKKKIIWAIIILIVLAIIYFTFSSGTEQTTLSGIDSAMSGGSILK